MTDFRAQREVMQEIKTFGWFRKPGAYILVDGQFGSTGKGVLASILAEAGRGRISVVTTNAGPNSGHTAYSPIDGKKIVTRQIPVASVVMHWTGWGMPAYLNAGAIIDLAVLKEEEEEYRLHALDLIVHPCAAVIRNQDKVAENDKGSASASIASTGKGVGAALAAKIMREGNVIKSAPLDDFALTINDYVWDWKGDIVLVETAQGFSLGVNEKRFYPHTTSRECTVMQAIADARIPPSRVRKVAACYRTFPIRVGNTDVGTSGDGYPDQEETTWEKVGVVPEYTTVTHRMRRVFTWSDMQFRESVAANEPDLLFVNFMNYVAPGSQRMFLRNVVTQYKDVMGRLPEIVLAGYGPHNSNAVLYDY